MEELAERLARLERTCRRWRWAGVLTASCLVGAPIAFLLIAMTISERIPEIDGLVIRDREGAARLEMGTLPDGSPRIWLRGQDGKVRVDLSLREADAPTILFLDREGRDRLSVELGDQGPALRLNDESGRNRLLMSVAQDDSPILGFRGSNGEFGVRRTDPDGTSRLDMLDRDGKLRMALSLGKGGLPGIALMDDEEKPRLGVILDQEGIPRVLPPRP